MEKVSFASFAVATSSRATARSRLSMMRMSQQAHHQGVSTSSRLSSTASTSTAQATTQAPAPQRRGNQNLLRAISYTLFGLTTSILLYWSGTHYYVESLPLSSPSGPSNPAQPDIYGWQEEAFPWTGGQNGGTSKEIGWRGRMALRAAWMAMTWGVGDGLSLPWHHDVPLPNDIVDLFPDFLTIDENFKDRRYEVALGHVNEAILAARKKGVKFPETLLAERKAGPPSGLEGSDHDPAGRDLLLVKAGVLERLGTVNAVGQARVLYEQVLLASKSDGSPGQEATIMRLAHKVGEMYSRQGEGEDGLAWWSWGLKRVGLRIPRIPDPMTTRSWFGFGKTTIIQPEPSPISTALIPQLAPPVHRATITLLASISTHLASTEQLPLASAVQRTALSLLPGTHNLPAPLKEDAPLILHDTWLQHRSATIALNHSEVLHALHNASAQQVCNTAQERANNVWSAIYPLPKPYTYEGVPWHSSAVALQRDAASLVAESSYTKGLLMELSMDYDPEEVMGLYETAMRINARRRGTWDEDLMDDDWQRYNKRYSRLQEVFGRRDMMDEIEDDSE